MFDLRMCDLEVVEPLFTTAVYRVRFRLSAKPSWTAAAAAARSVSQPQLKALQAPPRSNSRGPMRRPSSLIRLKTRQRSCPSLARVCL